MKLPKQAKPVMRKVGAVNHFGLGMRPSPTQCSSRSQNELGACILNNFNRIPNTTCFQCCGMNQARAWRGHVTGLAGCR